MDVSFVLQCFFDEVGYLAKGNYGVDLFGKVLNPSGRGVLELLADLLLEFAHAGLALLDHCCERKRCVTHYSKINLLFDIRVLFKEANIRCYRLKSKQVVRIKIIHHRRQKSYLPPDRSSY